MPADHTLKPAVRLLGKKDWRVLEALFGDNGACGGCWCMFWRHPKGESWDDAKGETNRARFEKLVESGEAEGVLAFVGDAPAGWLALGARTAFERLDRAPSLACDDAERVWSLPCFFIHRKFRGQGVATALLGFAVGELGRRGVEVVEAYPVKPNQTGKPMPAAFAWTGTVSLFEKAGFARVGPDKPGKQRMRKVLGCRLARAPAGAVGRRPR